MKREDRRAGNKSQKPYEILIVEDDKALLSLMQKTLQNAGYPVLGVSSGSEAIKCIVENPDLLVFLDYKLPDMTANQVIETLTKKRLRPNFIIITGYGDERIAVKMMKLGARDYLLKDPDFIDHIPSTVSRMVKDLEMEERVVKGEKELQKKQHLNELLLNSLPHPALLINKNRIVLTANEIAKDIGTKVGDYCWKTFGKSEYLSEENKKLAKKNPHANGIKCTFCLMDEAFSDYKDKNDPKVHAFDRIWDTYWIPLDGETFLHYAIDITDRNQAEEKLKDTKTFLDNVIQSAPDAIITVDLNDEITTFSPSAEMMFGYKTEDIIGKPVVMLYPKRQRKKRKGWKEKLLKDGQLERIRTKQVKANGKTFDVSLSMALLKDAKKRPIGIVGVSHDITKHLKAERDLNNAYNDLKKLDRMKAEFLQNVTHELRTPITAMLTTTRLLKDHVEDERLREILKVNERSTWRLNWLVGELLDAGMIERDVFKLKLEPLDIRELITNAMANFHSYATEREITVKSDLDEGLPKIVADKECIHRVVSNLLDNAIKFNQTRGCVEVKASKKNSHVEVSVENTGSGIDEEDQKKVFDRFYQVDGSTTRKYPGTGIGLSLTKEIIELHGGKIWVESEPEKWTRFTFTHPVGIEDGLYNDNR